MFIVLLLCFKKCSCVSCNVVRFVEHCFLVVIVSAPQGLSRFVFDPFSILSEWTMVESRGYNVACRSVRVLMTTIDYINYSIYCTQTYSNTNYSL